MGAGIEDAGTDGIHEREVEGSQDERRSLHHRVSWQRHVRATGMGNLPAKVQLG